MTCLKNDDYLSSISEVNYSIDSGLVCNIISNSHNLMNNQLSLEDAVLRTPTPIQLKVHQMNPIVSNLVVMILRIIPIVHSQNTQESNRGFKESILTERTYSNNFRCAGNKRYYLTRAYPTEIWKTAEEAKIDLDSWAYNLQVGCGCFSLNWGGHTSATSKKGFQRVLVCHRSGKCTILGEKGITSSLKCNCPFRISIMVIW